MAINVQPITSAEHGIQRDTPWVSFLQTPAWAKVKSEWQSESIGWSTKTTRSKAPGWSFIGSFQTQEVSGLPPEASVIDWETDDIAAWLKPLAEYAKDAGAFGVRIGTPVVARKWRAETIKAAIADEEASASAMPCRT